jgi:hypothetical protein
LAKLFSTKFAIYQLRSLKSFFDGFGTDFYLSVRVGPFTNKDHKSSDITLDCLLIDAAIIKENKTLSF